MRWNISQSVRHWARVKPGAVAVAHQQQRISWRSFDNAVDVVAASLLARGVSKGDRVACAIGNRPEHLATFFGIARVGAVFVPVNTTLTSHEISHIFSDAGVRVAVTDKSLMEVVTSAHPSLPVLDIDSIDLYGDTVSPPSIHVPADGDLVAILYTSGTTGRPKGAMFTHASFHATAQTMISSLRFRGDDVHLINSPLHFTGGILTLTQPAVLSGATIVIEKFSGSSDMIQQIREHTVTVCLSVPAILTLLAADPQFSKDALDSVRVLYAGSAPLPAPLIHTFQDIGIPLGQNYALTEGGGISSVLLASDVTSKIGSSGRSTLYTEVRVADEQGRALPIGEVGEVQQSGPTVTTGYWRNPEATAGLFTPDGWIRTGDLGTMDEEGFLTVVGRSKDVIIAGGVNIYPAEVEAALSEHPDISEIAVIGVPHRTYGETVTAIIVPREGSSGPSLEELRSFSADRLAAFKVPRIVHVVPSLPRTASGKVRKVELRRQLLT